jgi:uncharacterized damage-inducible protein DinB
VYRTVTDFLADFSEQNVSTLKVLDSLTDASLGQAVAPGGRTLGRIAWHIVHTLWEMPAQAGLLAPAGEVVPPTSSAALVAAYRAASAAVASAVGASWTDAMLAGEIPMYGEHWPRGRVLSALIRHEDHHRGQVTVLMRQAGLPVPGVFGPSQEGWVAFGVAAQD